MTVYRKKNNGSKSKYWYYNFSLYGTRYNKSTYKTEKKEAILVEEKLKQEIIDRHAQIISDGANDIKIESAVELAIAKPVHKPRGPKQDQRKRQVWKDFISWANATYPHAEHLHHVTRPMAEAYIMQLRKNGKFIKRIKQPGKRAFVSTHKLAPKTLNSYQKEVQWVFEQLIADAGLSRNPFTHIRKLRGTKIKREAYTNEEIKLIENAVVDNPFCKYLYYVGTGTGMRMGNICLLRWEDIDMEARLIQCVNLKTEGKLTIPILNELHSYLSGLIPQSNGYVSEDHAAKYKHCDTNVSLIFIKFLNEIGIVTKAKVEGRTRACNIKGIHAMRHTFIYRAMIARIPINIIQCIVGHVDDDVTKMYADHVMAGDAQRAMEGFSITEDCKDQGNLITDLTAKLVKMTPEKLKQLLDFVS